ncbi:MAG: transposase [Proteobacteria bacterium]|nr:MAG: transposase [Pseudomonadota bacterium]
MPVKPWGTGPGHRSLRRGRWSLPHHAYLITTVTHERNPIFRDLCVARILIHEMRYHEQSGWLRSLAWVVMPDHLHWLFILERSCSLAQLIKSLKGRSARSINGGLRRSGRVWQQSFHDHGVRDDEDLRVLARYVVANPLRAGLVERLAEYPHWDAVWLD